jgi:hypothetical protein
MTSEDYAKHCLPGAVCPAYRDGNPEMCACIKREDAIERRIELGIHTGCATIFVLVVLAIIVMWSLG